MKRSNILIGLICLSLKVMAQGQSTSYIMPDTTRYSTPALTMFMNEDMFWSGKDFRWDSRHSSFINISFLSRQVMCRTDILASTFTYLNVSMLSIVTFNFPMNLSKQRFYSQLFYPLPIGARLPVLSGRKYDIGINMNYYWPVNFRKEDHDSMYYESIIIDKNTKTTYKNTPQILDFNIEFKVQCAKFVGISVVAGYQQQLSAWYGKNYGSLVYTNNITGPYLGLSLNFTEITKVNNGLRRWEKTKSENSLASYGKFLADYPGNHYEKEAGERMEDILYLNALRGDEADCKTYLSESAMNNYRKEVERRLTDLDNSAFSASVKGTATDCESYIARFPDGKHLSQVKKMLARKLEIIDSTDYRKAVAGTIQDCDDYIKIHPEGIYLTEVLLEKENKKEESYYIQARDGNYELCDRYLSVYPGGKYSEQVKSLRKEKYLMAEDDLFRLVKDGDYKACREYRTKFREGRYVNEVTALCLVIKYYGINKMTPLQLINPGISNIELVKSMPPVTISLNYDVVVVTASGSTVVVNALTSERIITEINIAPLSDYAVFNSSFGGPGTKMDITLLTKGFEYNDMIWYPTAPFDAIIFCTKDKIIGYNVRYVRKARE